MSSRARVAASAMSGHRRVGSSAGSGSKTISDVDPVSSSTIFASSRTVRSSGFPMFIAPSKSESSNARSPRTVSAT